jgi:hypothetical protein
MLKQKLINEKNIMSHIETLESNRLCPIVLVQGGKARIRHTGQIVEVKRVSEHGISVVSFRTGGEYFISNKFLEPLFDY